MLYGSVLPRTEGPPVSKTMVVTVIVNDDDPLNDAITSDALGDTCRDLEAAGTIVGFRFGGTDPADHVVGPGDVEVPTGA